MYGGLPDQRQKNNSKSVLIYADTNFQLKRKPVFRKGKVTLETKSYYGSGCLNCLLSFVLSQTRTSHSASLRRLESQLRVESEHLRIICMKVLRVYKGCTGYSKILRTPFEGTKILWNPFPSPLDHNFIQSMDHNFYESQYMHTIYASVFWDPNKFPLHRPFFHSGLRYYAILESLSYGHRWGQKNVRFQETFQHFLLIPGLLFKNSVPSSNFLLQPFHEPALQQIQIQLQI